jgi:hypothetical protein
LCVLGSSTFAASLFLKGTSAMFPLMLLGRLLFGSGNGSLTSEFCLSDLRFLVYRVQRTICGHSRTTLSDLFLLFNCVKLIAVKFTLIYLFCTPPYLFDQVFLLLRGYEMLVASLFPAV